MKQKLTSILKVFISTAITLVVADFRIYQSHKEGFRDKYKDNVKAHVTFVGPPYNSYWKYTTKIGKTVVASCIHAPSHEHEQYSELEKDFYFEGLGQENTVFNSLDEDHNLRCGYHYVGDELERKDKQPEDLQHLPTLDLDQTTDQ